MYTHASASELTNTEHLLVNSIDEAILLVGPALDILQMNDRAQALFEVEAPTNL